MIVRPEAEDDYAAVDRIVTEAFGRPNEAQLVRLIRASRAYVPHLALVAEDEGEVVGHAMFSHVTLGQEEEGLRVLSLAPVSVTPGRQGEGIGGALIEAGLQRAGQDGEPLVVLMGHPAYYPRFGFKPARGYGIEPHSPDVPDTAFMVRPLPAYEKRYRGRVVYPPAFEATGTL